MVSSEHYRMFHDLMLVPESVYLLTHGEDRYLTDKYALVHVNMLPTPGIDVLAEIPDGFYSLRRTKPPRKEGGAYELDAEKIGRILRTFRGGKNWSPLQATCWATVGYATTRILARCDSAGITPVGVNSDLWDRWHTQMEDDPQRRWSLQAFQPDGRPTHPIRFDLSYTTGSRGDGAVIRRTVTVGSIVPVRLDGIDQVSARVICERSAGHLHHVHALA